MDDDNDGILDIDEMVLGSTPSAGSFSASLEAWQTTGFDVIAGEPYAISDVVSSEGTMTVSGGPNDGQEVTIIRFSNTRFVDLDGNFYFNDGSFSGPAAAASTQGGIGFANLPGNAGALHDTNLTFVGLIDTNGNGQFDAGVDEIVPIVFSENRIVGFTPTVSGTLHLVFADQAYADNAGTVSYTHLTLPTKRIV